MLEDTVGYMSNSRDKVVINKLMDYPMLRSLWLYHPTNYRPAAWCAIVLFPVGLPVYLVGLRQLRILRGEVERIEKVSTELIDIIEKTISTT